MKPSDCGKGVGGREAGGVRRWGNGFVGAVAYNVADIALLALPTLVNGGLRSINLTQH